MSLVAMKNLFQVIFVAGNGLNAFSQSNYVFRIKFKAVNFSLNR